jgi:hypothetical protein
MFCKWKAVPAVALFALLAVAPAYGTVTVYFVPQHSFIPAPGGTTDVDVVADFTDAIVGWGLDLDVGLPGVADLIGFSIGPLWDPVGASIDGDGLGGTADPFAHPNGIGPGNGILLATLTFEAFGNGVTPILMNDDGDEDEGFALNDLSGLDGYVSEGGTITVPEPASLSLLALAGLVALRRRS